MGTNENNMKKVKEPSFGFALLSLLGSVAFIIVGTLVFKATLHMMFLLTWLIVFAVGIYLGHSFESLENGAYDMIKTALQPIMILLAVGAMVGTWIASGTVPSIIYYGLKLINPKIFLLLTLLLCSITSLATGTSWGTIGTAGLAMVGIGMGMGINPGLVAGAAVSGSYFGDKLSPLSDSTILAAAVAKTNIVDHIKHMLWTVTPGYIISAILYLILGMKYAGANLDYNRINEILVAMENNFNIGFLPFIPAIVVIVLLASKKPAFPSILIGAIIGSIIAVFYQGQTVSSMLNIMYNGFKIDSGTPFLDTILNRGGVTSMRDNTNMMICAFGFSGILRTAGILDAIIKPLTKRIKSVFGLVFATFCVNWSFLATGATMSFASVMTGTLLEPVYRKWRLKPQNLSRAIEDFGTMGGPLIPYGANALYISGMFGIAPMTFIPFCFLNIIVPIISLTYAFFGFTMYKYKDDEVVPEA